MESVCSSETLVPVYQTSRCCNPDDHTLKIFDALSLAVKIGVYLVLCEKEFPLNGIDKFFSTCLGAGMSR
jgi:hypothetical protein